MAIAVPANPSHTYDGSIDNLDINLSTFAGRSGQVILRVYAHDSSAQDWAVWVNPRILN